MQDERKLLRVQVGQTEINLPTLTEDEWKNLDWGESDSEEGVQPHEEKENIALANICAFMQKVAPPSWLWDDELPVQTKQVIIGICGRKNHGKDVIANYFVSYREGFAQLAFADPLKESVKSRYDLTEEQLHDPIKKEEIDPRHGLSPRQMFQKCGTSIRNDLGDNFFIDYLFCRCYGLKRICVSDVRRQNEVNEIRKRGGVIIKVFRPGQNDDDDHESETDIQHIKEDFFVCNDGNIMLDLFPKLDRICEEVVEQGFFTKEDLGKARWED